MGKIIRKAKGSVVVPAEGEIHAKCFNEAEIHKRAKADPDAQPLTKEQLSKFKPVKKTPHKLPS